MIFRYLGAIGGTTTQNVRHRNLITEEIPIDVNFIPFQRIINELEKEIHEIYRSVATMDIFSKTCHMS